MVNVKQMQAMPSQDADAWVSTLMDGEIDDAEAKRAIARVHDDAEAGRLWRDYCLVSDALHGDATDTDAFMRRFRGALDAEPTVLAPVKARKSHTAPYLWTAAAATMATITWTVWTASPPDQGGAPMVEAQALASAKPDAGSNDDRFAKQSIEPYLAAHQDYAYAVVSVPDMVVEKVGLAGQGR